MTGHRLQRWAGTALGAAVLAGATLAVSYRALAQGQNAPAPPDAAAFQRPPGQPGAPPAPPFPGGPGGGPGFRPIGPPPLGIGGPASLTATETHVYVLRGNTLYAFDAKTLKQTAKAELPAPEPHPRVPGDFRPGGRIPGGAAPGRGGER